MVAYHQYQIVGRHLPTDATPEPTVYRMKLCVPWQLADWLRCRASPAGGAQAHALGLAGSRAGWSRSVLWPFGR